MAAGFQSGVDGRRTKPRLQADQGHDRPKALL
jgi:hypothetical protein